jgi:ribosomal protein S27E
MSAGTLKAVKVRVTELKWWKWTCPQCRAQVEANIKIVHSKNLSRLKCGMCGFKITKTRVGWIASGKPDRSSTARWRIELQKVADEMNKSREKALKQPEDH